MAFRPFPSGMWRRFALMGVALTVLAGCNAADFPKAQRPVPGFLKAKMTRLGMKDTSQIFIRIFKEESQMEVWKQRADGQFNLLKTYDICKWSGKLGPKKQEGDRQAPEGFYTVTPAQMNPNSSYYLSFNIGYPNAYDRSLGRTGTNLMVHGACSSAGCYSMTDEDAGEIFALARDSFRGGQTSFQIQAFPFRMTPENLAKHRDNENMEFWRMLKVGYDAFELTHKPPKVDVCDRHYVFEADPGGAKFSAASACPAYTTPPALTAALEKKTADDEVKFTRAVAMLEAKQQEAAVAEQRAAERDEREGDGNACEQEREERREDAGRDHVGPAMSDRASPPAGAPPRSRAISARHWRTTSPQPTGIAASLHQFGMSSMVPVDRPRRKESTAIGVPYHTATAQPAATTASETPSSQRRGPASSRSVTSVMRICSRRRTRAAAARYVPQTSSRRDSSSAHTVGALNR